MNQNTASFERTESVRIGLFVPLCLYLVFAPLLDNLSWVSITHEGAGLFDWQRVLECWSIAVALAVACVWLCLWRGQIPLPRRAIYASCLVFLMGALSIVFRDDLYREAWREWLLFLELWMLGVVLCVAAAGLGNRLADVVVTVLTGGALCYLMLILVINHSNNWMEIPFEQFIFVGFINVRMFNDWQGFLLPLFPLLFTQYCVSRSSRLFLYLLGVLFYTLLFVSGARGVLFSLVVAHLVFVAIFRTKYVLMFARSCAFLVSGGVFYWICKLYVLPQDIGFVVNGVTGGAAGPGGRGLTIQAMTHPAGRLELWEQAVGLAGQAFPFGVGPGMFAAYPNSLAAASHNALLNIAAEWGWIVAGVSVYIVVRYFMRHMQRLKSELADGSRTILSEKRLDVQFSILFALLALFVQSFISTNVLLGTLTPLCVLVGVAVIAGYRPPQEIKGESNVKSVGVRWSLACVAMVISTVVFMSIVSQDFSDVGKRNAAYRECNKPTPWFSPRFWTQGWLTNSCQ